MKSNYQEWDYPRAFPYSRESMILEDREPELTILVDELNRSGVGISLDWNNGSTCCTETSSGEYLSPRMTSEKMKLWLDGFSAGIDQQKDVDSRQTRTGRFFLSAIIAVAPAALLLLLLF
jgi:hypothetical protein